jgi:hypothetical protein
MTLTPKQRDDLVEKLSTSFPELAFDRNAFDKFFDITDHGGWKGKSAAGWLESVNLRERIVSKNDGHFCPKELDRQKLHEYCRQTGVSDLESFVAVMAWGGMSVRNGRLALRAPKTVLELVRQIRHSVSGRAADYERFYRARKAHSITGIGPAYYTKLLFFLRTDRTSYILDQWTAKSIHVLTRSRAFPKIASLPNNQARVPDDITPEEYEKYCRIVDVIAGHARPLGWTGADVEEHMFSDGGRTPKPWRKHVKKHWPALR